MKYQVKSRLNLHYLAESKIGEDRIYRDIAHKFIDDMPIEAVKKLFKLRKYECGDRIHVEYFGEISIGEKQFCFNCQGGGCPVCSGTGELET